MKDTKLIIPRSDLEIIIAKFYHLKDVSVWVVTDPDGMGYAMENLTITANYPKKRRTK